METKPINQLAMHPPMNAQVTPGMNPGDWQRATGTHALKRVQRKGFKAYRCLEGVHKGDIVKFRLEGIHYVFDSIEEGK